MADEGDEGSVLTEVHAAARSHFIENAVAVAKESGRSRGADSAATQGDDVVAMVVELGTASEAECPRIAEAAATIIDKYQEGSHLLDAYLERLIKPLIELARKAKIEEARQSAVFHLLYVLSKVRGYKKIVKFFGHDASDFHPTVQRLEGMDPADKTLWEQRYIMLLWLSLTCMLPFDMAVLDSGGETSDVRRIVACCYTYLEAADKAREAAAILVGRLTTRPDMAPTLLPEFLGWAREKLVQTDPNAIEGMVTLTGVLLALAYIFKLGKRAELLPHAAPLLQYIEEQQLHTCPNTLLRKLTCKLVQRIGLTFLPPRLAAWRYQRGKRRLMGGLADGGAVVGGGGVAEAAAMHDTAEDDYDVPEEIETVIELLLSALKDKDTIVRWSAAKGIGRITGRLPLELADEVVIGVQELCTHREGDGAWHGACLALAELGRRGLLLPSRLPEVVPVVLRALGYDELRGACSVGAHVRDAACYVAWAFARAYDPAVIKVHITEIARSLMVVTVFDREVNVRRAASAAFQENVGRQGTLPNGIDIVTLADYFAVGNRTRSYLEIAVFIAKFPEYTSALLDHLCDVKLSHWDRAIRELAARALHALAPTSPASVASRLAGPLLAATRSVDLNTRHGAVLAIGEAVAALTPLGRVDPDVAERCAAVVVELGESGAYRGAGGEMLRSAVSAMVARLSTAGVRFSPGAVRGFQGHVDGALVYDETGVQDGAIAAFEALCTGIYAGGAGGEGGDLAATAEIVTRYVTGLTGSGVPARSRRGYAAALGCLPPHLLAPHAPAVFGALLRASVRPEVVHEIETDARRLSLLSLTRLALGGLAPGKPTAPASDAEQSRGAGADPTAGSGGGVGGEASATLEQVPAVFDALLDGTQDYTIDSRGDIGSRVREAAMECLERLVWASAESPAAGTLLTPDLVARVAQALAQQATEKIDRTRGLAGEILARLCGGQRKDAHGGSNFVPHVPRRAEVAAILGPAEELHWQVPRESFPRVVQLLRFDEYREAVLTGLVVSVGGLTESLVKASSACLLSHLASYTPVELEQFALALLGVFKRHALDDRVTVPLLTMVDLLFCTCVLEPLLGVEPVTSQLLALTRAEMKKTQNVKKLRAGVEVLCGLMLAAGEVRRKALSSLMLYICHRFPRVRKFTAEQFYVGLMTVDGQIDPGTIEQVHEILTETLWDGDLTAARVERNKICDLLGVAKPKVTAAGAAAAAGPKKKEKDDLDSYRDLVDRAMGGY